MKKVAKITYIGLCLLCPLILVVGFATNWKQQTNISCVGSSGVKPFVELISNDYSNQPLDITVEAGGSGFGIEELSKDHCNIGTTSTNPYVLVNNNDETLKAWDKKRIKTITIGWEAICLVYKLPNGLSQKAKENFEISINENNVIKLFSTFSGFKNTEYDSNWLDFIEDTKDFSSEDKTILKNSTIIPYVRSGGNTTSGTAMAFCYETHFNNFNFENLDDRQKQAFIAGQYGHDFEIYQTDETNSRSWDMFCKNNIPGSMLYLSSGFVETNRKLIDKYGYKIAKYDGNPYTIENAKNHKYKWFRPINCSFSLENEKIKTFLDDILKNKTKNGKLFEENGAFFVNDDEISSMTLQKDKWLSDIELQKERPDKIYGAITKL